MAQIQGSEVFAFVECRDISKVYRQGREKVQALEKISLKILPSQAVAVVGPSGCGKTTLLNIIGCLLAPDSGTLLFYSMLSPYHQSAAVIAGIIALIYTFAAVRATRYLTSKDVV